MSPNTKLASKNDWWWSRSHLTIGSLARVVDKVVSLDDFYLNKGLTVYYEFDLYYMKIYLKMIILKSVGRICFTLKIQKITVNVYE
jgi:hypothetical protein